METSSRNVAPAGGKMRPRQELAPRRHRIAKIRGDVSLKFPMSRHAFCESRPTYPRLQPASASASAKLQASAQPMRRLNSRT
jgi:hypothetical protein